MTKQIWKIPVVVDKKFIALVPKQSELLTVQVQRGMPYMWFLVDKEYPTTERVFEVFTTGQDIKYDMGVERKYISTFQLDDGMFVGHLFERIH